jgi:hypothetical protein
MQFEGKEATISRIQSSLTSSNRTRQSNCRIQVPWFSEVYVADPRTLLLTAQTTFSTSKPLKTSGVSLMVDAGLTSLDRAQKTPQIQQQQTGHWNRNLQTKRFVSEALAEFGISPRWW